MNVFRKRAASGRHPWQHAAAAVISLTLCGCAGSFIPDYPDAVPDIQIPDGLAFDIPDVQADATADETKCARNCYDRVCGPDGCGGDCGTCPPGTVCSLDYSICLAQAVLLPDGSPCGRNSVCAPELADPFTPGEYYDNPDWPRCMDHQCQGLLCESGMCTRPCVVHVDETINGTGISGADGIEDNIAESDCVAAAGTLHSGDMMCAGRKAARDGSLQGVCVPAASFMPCNPSDKCQGDEACGYIRTKTGMERRCLAALDSGAAYAGTCGYDQASGISVACVQGFCSDRGCTKPCDKVEDCLSVDAKCDRGLCRGTGQACIADGDCSSWVCGAAVGFDDTPVSACRPRSCGGDLECPGDFFCSPDFGLDQTGNVIASGWCAPVVAGGAPVGAPCGGGPDGPVTVCRNRDMCIDGYCSARCRDDLDCFVHGDMRCSLSQTLYAEGYISVDQWIETGYCVPTGYRREGCTSDSDCGGRVCTPFVSKGMGEAEVVTTCMEPPPDSWPLGTACGELAWDAVCRSRFCFGSDVPDGIPGWCSQLCATDADCPESQPWLSQSFRWICAGLPVLGGDSPRADDDLFASWCVPVPAASSWQDCGATRVCPDTGEVCSPILRAGPGISEERVDYRCVTAGPGTPPGTICNPFGDGSDCSTGICSPSATSDIGFCSFTCGNDIDCAAFGETVTCQAAQVGLDSSGNPLSADVCRMTGECIVCQDDTDCPAAGRCVNIAGSYWWEDMRCVRECTADEDCADITGMACSDVAPVFSASSLKLKACMTPSCS